MLSFSTDDYIEPEWSSQPINTFHLQIIKEGTIIGNINIKQKAFVLIGRDNDLCDLCINNPSVSRKHAILQFKKNENYPYLYDLGGVHGTEVNHHKLPIRAYEKLKAFDVIKFGISSRFYVLRCPLLEQQENEHEAEEENKFQQLLSENKKEVSKQQLKQKYLDLLYHDPCFKANNQLRTLQGSASASADSFSGVNWGISDEYEVYAYRNQSEFQLEPDVLRRLPGLDHIQLNKISDYQTNFGKYTEVQAELSELANKQKREYGLQQKLKEKKQKLEKRLIEALQVLEKSEDWIRVNIFGQNALKVTNKQKTEKQNDTFEGDQFVDRTLAEKREKKQQIQKKQQKNVQFGGQNIFTTHDYWKLQKELRNQLKTLISLEKQYTMNNEVNHRTEGINEAAKADCLSQPRQDEDDLETYMKYNNTNLEKQQYCLAQSRIAEHQQKIKQITSYLIPLVGQSEVSRIEDEERGIRVERNKEELEKIRKEQENRNKISEVLHKLDIIKEEEEIDEEDVKIFDYYRNCLIAEDDSEEAMQINHHTDQTSKRERPSDLSAQHSKYERQRTKYYPMHPKQKEQCRDVDEEQYESNNQFQDLTKFIN